MASSEKRSRGPNKGARWALDREAGISVVRLALDVGDPVQRASVEAMFEGAFQIRRALQRGARNKTRAYWAATRSRATDPSALRDRLGLTRPAFERVAYAHLDAAPHLRRYVTKALAMHIADAVWPGIERHLFFDSAGKRHGEPRIGRWDEFRRLPGRARSHTIDRKWETFRLHGTLAGHRAAYTDRSGDFVQPRRLRPAHSDAWWSYTGPLAIVFTGLASGTLVLPVRLPTAPSSQPFLEHHLADPSRWHKVDLVRCRDARGGWRYEAHLMVLVEPYASSAVATARSQVADEIADRVAGIDVNVSNLTIASHEDGGAMRLTRVARNAARKAGGQRLSRRERRLRRAMDRSRRAENPAQYERSKAQQRRAARRAAAGLAPVFELPAGRRRVRSDGKPEQSYRRDRLSAQYQRLRAKQTIHAEAAARLRNDLARQAASRIVATHGTQFVVEDCHIATWAKSWGKHLAAFSPATLINAIDREARLVAALCSETGGVQRVGTRATALSQHCPCGARVSKDLVERVHECPSCHLRGNRDAVAAVLASFVRDGSVDYVATTQAMGEIRRVLRSSYEGWQDTLSESNDLSTRDGSSVVWWTSTPDRIVVARRNVGTATCSTRNEASDCWTTSDRARLRTGMSASADTS